MKFPAAMCLSPRWGPYVFLSRFVILFVVFGLFPLVFSLFLAFQSWEPTSGLRAMEFVGLDNYAFALQDEWFWKSLRNTGWLLELQQTHGGGGCDPGLFGQARSDPARLP
jgi:multiple sugar transport system permease protein